MINKSFIFIILFLKSLFLLSQVPEKPSYNSYVYDYAGVLSEDQNYALREVLFLFDSITTNQTVLVILDDLNGQPIENFSLELGEAWGVGLQGEDNGILITTSLVDRQIRIEVGYGLEPIITDYWSSSHIREDIAPSFITENYFIGLYTLIQNMIQEIEPNFIFPEINENLGVEKREPLNIPQKPTPFNHITDNAQLLDNKTLNEAELYIKEIGVQYNIPIHFYLFNNPAIAQNEIFEFGYKVQERWDFPYIYDDGREEYEDGVLIIYNIATNSGSAIVGNDYSSELHSTYPMVDSLLLNPQTSIVSRLKNTSLVFAETYHSEFWFMIYIIVGTVLGLFLFIFLIVKFGGGSSSSSSSYSGTFGGSGYSSSSSSSYSGSGNSGSFGGGSFGGGGATGSW